MIRRPSTRGFTLLEMLVATTIMGIAVVGLLSSLSTSMRNASRIADADRAAALARGKMEELIADRTLPYQGSFSGSFDATSGWTAQLAPFEVPPNARPGMNVLQRIALVVWWQNGENRHEFPIEAYRSAPIPLPVTGVPQP